MNVLCCTCCYCNSYMCVLWVYLHVPLPGLDVLLDNGLYLFLLLILHSFSTFLHFYIPTHLHRLLLMSYHWSLFRLSCHYCQTVNIYFIIYPSFSLSILYFLSLGWEHLLHLMSVALNDLVDEGFSWLGYFGILMILTHNHSCHMSCHVI